SLHQSKYVFAGFNALSAAEEKIIQHLLMLGNAEVYWDIDDAFLNDPLHDAGLFIRRCKDSWRHYKSQPFQWIQNDFSQPKNIEVIGTPKSVGQAKIAGSIIDTVLQKNPDANLDKVAIVLAE